MTGKLPQLIDLVRAAPAVQAKRELTVTRRLAMPPDGDDGAAVLHGNEYIVVCGEAMYPPFVRSDPYAAGAAAVVTNVSDMRAMGGTPIGLVDMLISPDSAHAALVLDGISWAAELLGVAVLGGHSTIGYDAALAASCTGVAKSPLFGRNAKPGDELLVAFSLEGRYHGNGLFFSSLHDRRPELLREDGSALVEVAESGTVHAARDVSMPGVAGSLLQLLETAGCGATLELDRIPHPPGVPLERWLLTFPSFGFLLAASAGAAAAAAAPFRRRGLACAQCGRFDDTGVLQLGLDGAHAPLWDLAAEPFTSLSAAASRAA